MVVMESMTCIQVLVKAFTFHYGLDALRKNESIYFPPLRFILSFRSDFHMTDSLSLAVHAFARRVLISLSVDETLLPW